MPTLSPINFKKWIEDNRHLLKPPVGNKLVWEDSEFIVMVIGGPNARTDYHVNSGEEFFYQVEGNIVLKVIENGRPVEIPLAEGEIFLLPPNVPHSPRRPAGTVGLVIERKRTEKELDGFVWHCENCGAKMYEEFFELTDIIKQFPPIFDRFYNSAHSTCKACGTKMHKPQ
jgi:3-hydroxyanthranilate 3,4-dioxygenase